MKLSEMTWGTVTIGGGLFAIVCPRCGCMVTIAVDPVTGRTGKEVHIESHGVL